MKQLSVEFRVLVILVTLLLAPIFPAAADIGIEGPKWHLMEVSNPPVSPKPFIIFNATNKQASGFAGCNNFFGNYELDGSSLKFGPVGTTRMFCEGAAGEVEMRFMELLEQIRIWELRDGTLLLHDGSKVLARFTTKE